jgi:hypothetical protein
MSLACFILFVPIYHYQTTSNSITLKIVTFWQILIYTIPWIYPNISKIPFQNILILLYSSCQVKLPISTQRFHLHCVFNDQISNLKHEFVFLGGGMQPSISYDYCDNFQKASSGLNFDNISNFNYILTNSFDNVCL